MARESGEAGRPRGPDDTERSRFALALRRGTAAWLAVVALVATAGAASAHRLSGEEIVAPVPLRFVFVGAGATVALTALWLAAGDRAVVDVGARPVARLPPRAARGLALAGRAGVLALFAAALVHGVVGRQVAAENLATTALWPLLLKGMAVVAVLAGSPWRVVSPWETLYDLLAALEGRDVAALGSYPDRLGSWPAVAGFVLGVGVLENLTLVTRSPRLTVAVAATYAVAMLLGGVAFGREWFARADALAVLFRLFGRVAVLDVRRTDDGAATVALRPPWTGGARPLASASLVVFVVAALYTVSFDGFTATRLYQRLLIDARSALGVAVADVALYAVGLAGFVASYLAAAAAVERLGADDGEGWAASAQAFGGTLLPIAAVYEVAHNYPFVASNLGQALTVGRDLALGGGDPVRPLGWMPLAGFWVSQVALVVLGHVVAVVAAHRVAVRRYPTPTAARRGHAPLVAVMVGYTLLSLWIVSRPVAG